jgi:hypothetical protein
MVSGSMYALAARFPGSMKMHDRGLFGDTDQPARSYHHLGPGHKYRHNHTEKTAGKQPMIGKHHGTLLAAPGHCLPPRHKSRKTETT